MSQIPGNIFDGITEIQDKFLTCVRMSKADGLRSVLAVADEVLADSQEIAGAVRGNRSDKSVVTWEQARAMLLATARRAIEILENE